MKRTAAIILSLMFTGLQVMSSVPIFSSATQASRCCGCKKHECCVAGSNPDAQPLPAAPAPANPQHELSLLPAVAVAWTLPLSDYPSAISADRLSPLATAVPLFTRHCALLI
jgi:hypothetical protein